MRTFSSSLLKYTSYVLTALMLCLVGLSIMKTTKHLFAEQVIEQHSLYYKNYENTMSFLLKNHIKAHEFLEKTCQQDSFCHYLILYNTSQIESAYGPIPQSLKSIHPNTLQPLHSNDMVIPILDEDKTQGYLYVGFNKNNYANQEKSFYAHIFLFLIACFLFVFEWLSFFMNYRLHYVNAYLSTIIEAIKKKIIIIPNLPITHDEISDVVKAYKSVALSFLRKYKQSVQSLRDLTTAHGPNESFCEEAKTILRSTFGQYRLSEVNHFKGDYSIRFPLFLVVFGQMICFCPLLSFTKSIIDLPGIKSEIVLVISFLCLYTLSQLNFWESTYTPKKLFIGSAFTIIFCLSTFPFFTTDSNFIVLWAIFAISGGAIMSACQNYLVTYGEDKITSSTSQYYTGFISGIVLSDILYDILGDKMTFYMGIFFISIACIIVWLYLKRGEVFNKNYLYPIEKKKLHKKFLSTFLIKIAPINIMAGASVIYLPFLQINNNLSDTSFLNIEPILIMVTLIGGTLQAMRYFDKDIVYRYALIAMIAFTIIGAFFIKQNDFEAFLIFEGIYLHILCVYKKEKLATVLKQEFIHVPAAYAYNLMHSSQFIIMGVGVIGLTFLPAKMYGLFYLSLLLWGYLGSSISIKKDV